MITLRFEDGLIKYCEVSEQEILEDDWMVHYLSDEKIAGKVDHPLTYEFIKQLLTKEDI